jgi:hypothetical protein
MKAIELPAFGTVGDRLGGVGESRQGMNGHVSFWRALFLDRRVVQKYRVFFLCANCAILVVFLLNCAKCCCPTSVLN